MRAASCLLDPLTGAIKALWSSPSYDPNLIASHDFEQAKEAKTLYDLAPGKPLLANSYQERYLPGSTFKVVTATGRAGEREVHAGLVLPARQLVPAAPDHQPHRELRRHHVRRHVRRGLPAQLQHGVRGDGRHRRRRRRWWPPPSASASTRRRPSTCRGQPARCSARSADFVGNIPLLAIAGFGQGNTQATPLQMALVASAVANGGRDHEAVRGRPHRRPRGPDADQDQPQRVATGDGARDRAPPCRALMIEVVNNGTAKCCMRLAGGAQAAAKTGTAQLNAKVSRRPATRGSSRSPRRRHPATPSPSS